MGIFNRHDDHTASSLFILPSAHRRPARAAPHKPAFYGNLPSTSEYGCPFPVLLLVIIGGRQALQTPEGVKSDCHVGRGTMQTTMQRPPCGWESRRRLESALDESSAQECASVGCRRVSLPFAEASSHASSPIHTISMPTISLCRCLRRCSPAK